MPDWMQYRNQYQTASKRYVPIAADTHGRSSEIYEKAPKMEVSGAIPALAYILNTLIIKGFRG